MSNPPTTIAAIALPNRPPRARAPLTLILLAALALALAAAGVMLALVHVGGLHVGFLLGGAGKGDAKQLGPFVTRVKGMSGPVAVLGAAFAVLGGTTGGTLLALGHPHGARMLGRVAIGAFVIAIAGTIVD